MIRWLASPDSPKVFLAIAATLVVGGASLFFGVIEDVISHDPLVDIDVWVFHLLRVLRTGPLDQAMVAITELGDPQVLMPVMMVALAWFVVRRLWLTVSYWITAIGVAELLAVVIKLALHRARPQLIYTGIEQYSFPSGHAVMSTVVYGFLAYLLLRCAPAKWRHAGTAAAILLIGLIGFSRLYLGAHWFSDVVGGLSFGIAWVAALAITYEYQAREDLGARKLAALVGTVFMISAAVHAVASHQADVDRYAIADMAKR